MLEYVCCWRNSLGNKCHLCCCWLSRGRQYVSGNLVPVKIGNYSNRQIFSCFYWKRASCKSDAFGIIGKWGTLSASRIVWLPRLLRYPGGELFPCNGMVFAFILGYIDRVTWYKNKLGLNEISPSYSEPASDLDAPTQGRLELLANRCTGWQKRFKSSRGEL